jgi:hypothetical protein
MRHIHWAHPSLREIDVYSLQLLAVKAAGKDFSPIRQETWFITSTKPLSDTKNSSTTGK